MLRAIFAVLLTAGLFCFSQVPRAQLSVTGVGGGFGGSGGGGFVGPGDTIASATAFYSCARGYSAAYSNGTNPLCDLNAVTGGAAVCTLRVATTGFADLGGTYCAGTTPALACAAATGGSCVVSKVYDTTVGNQCTASPTSCDLVQVTLANMPALSFSALNGLPCLTMGATSNLASATPLNAIATQPFTETAAAKQTSGGGNAFIFSGNPSTFWSGTTNAGEFAGSSIVTAAAALSAYHGISFIFDGASSGINVDNSLTSPLNPGTSALGTGGNHIILGDSSAGMVGSFCEGGIWPFAFSGGQQSSWFSNANGANGYNGGL